MTLDALSTLQLIIGLAIALGGLMIAAFSIDGPSAPFLTRIAATGLVCWGAWFAINPLVGHGHDSPPALAFGLLICYVLFRHRLQLNDILSGADWWPPNAKE